MSDKLLVKPAKQSITGLVLSLVALIILAIALQLFIPAFDAVFRSFGADLPLLTVLTQRFCRAVALLPVAVCLVWAFWPGPQRKRVRMATLFCWLSNLLIVLMAASMYLPIVRLGAIV